MPAETTPPYRPGIDDLGDAPLGADNALPAVENTSEPADPVKSEGEYRKAVLALLTQIRDAVVANEAP